jgi:RimJ/RimL family protein N-acetyltransferase
MITFRPHTREDVPSRVKWLNDYRAILYSMDESDHVTTKESQNNWFDAYEEKLEKGTKIFFTILSDSKNIGFIGLSNINKKIGNASVFILIGEDGYRGKGIGGESMDYLINYAFSILDLKSLYLEVDKSNLPAISLYEKLGFKKLGEDGKSSMMTLSKYTSSGLLSIPVASGVDVVV